MQLKFKVMLVDMDSMHQPVVVITVQVVVEVEPEKQEDIVHPKLIRLMVEMV
jgi:hypothetical protein